MQAWALFVHSVRQVFGNLGAALKITGLLYLAQSVFSISYSLYTGFLGLQIVSGVGPGSLLINHYLLTGTVIITCYIWLAIGWHRFILRNERPSGLLPKFQSQSFFIYLGYTLLTSFAGVSFVWIASSLIRPLDPFLSRLLLPVLNWWQLYVFLSFFHLVITVFPLAVLFLRISPVFPAAALAERLTLGEAWDKTRGTTGTLILVGLLVALTSMLVNFPAERGYLSGYWFLTIWRTGANWVIWMIGLSLLTTLYGHYVEGRPLVTQAT